MKYYITTTIPYANAEPHIGFASEILYADIMARYQRLIGKDVYFLTGTDEHGQKMYKTAKKLGREVYDYASEKSACFQNLADTWNISNNDFIRTTEDRHIRGVKEFWKKSFQNNDIYKKKYEGLYCDGCECFVTEKDLVDGKCVNHDREPELISEENYFFRLSKYEIQLKKLFKKTPDFVVPSSKYNEIMKVLEHGLEDVSISRSKEKLPWGIEVPGDLSQVMYVWFDALNNYITALGWGSGKSTELYKKYWPADVHVVGKDVNRFHSLLWPAMLMSVGLPLPKKIAVHGFMTIDNKKISKSLGNVIDPIKLLDQYSLDASRYFLAREIPFNLDGDYSDEKFRERYNADLANGLGNLTNRILVMIEKYSDNAVPAVDQVYNEMIDTLDQDIWKKYMEKMEDFNFCHALEDVWRFISYCDQLISDKKPWELFKKNKKREVSDLLHHLAEGLRHIAIMIWPIMPETGENILKQLGLDVSVELSKPLSELKNWVQLTVGNKIERKDALFPRLDNLTN
ncbi:MAG: methionine--tRNA ligase [bacterium]